MTLILRSEIYSDIKVQDALTAYKEYADIKVSIEKDYLKLAFILILFRYT